jgi:hypothetical protein
MIGTLLPIAPPSCQPAPIPARGAYQAYRETPASSGPTLRIRSAIAAAGFELQLVSSVALAQTRDALHNSLEKNDPEDAQVILRILLIDAVQIFHDPPVAGTSDIQELSKTYEMVARSKTQLQHRILTHCLPLSTAQRQIASSFTRLYTKRLV